ncbi:SpoIIE family protein phosphatase [Streptacidiphilus sp. N1-12]|uniref:SpoIIE family protein phosphatase n=2 Tax=Streptacidiphilus alkalitolerans TaxID=3342712 RepID=A0ABV6VMJ9_9ACTN
MESLGAPVEEGDGAHPNPELTPEVFDQAVFMIALTAGPEHRLVYSNEAFRGLFGDRPHGVPVREAFGDEPADPFLALLDQVYADTTARRLAAPRVVAGPGGGERHFIHSASPVRSRYGRGVLVALVDATAEVSATRRAELLSDQRLETLHRYEALVSAVSQMVWVARPDGSMTELVEGWESFTGQPWRSAMDAGWFEVIHPLDVDGLVEAWRRAAADRGMFEAVFRVRSTDGDYRHVQSRAVPVVCEGEVVEWIGATSDIEDQWRNRLREELMARAVAVTDTPHMDDAFMAMAAVVVPDLADACAIFLLTDPDRAPGGSVSATRVASVARPGLPPLPPMLRQEYLLGARARRVIAERRPTLLTFEPHAPPQGAVPTVSAAWLSEAEATALTLVPVIIDGRVVALAAAAVCGGRPRPDRAYIELLHEVLQLAQVPLGQSLELQRTRQVALALQRALLTSTPPVPGAGLAARYQPSSRTAEVGGDWFDAFLLPDGSLALTIGDVAGHDLAAATGMGQLRSMLRAIAYAHSDRHAPAEILAELDLAATGLDVAAFATVIHVHLVPSGGGWQAAWSNAGHPPPLLLPASGAPCLLSGGEADIPLCVDPARPRTTHHRRIDPGDTLVLFTDGLVEIPGEHLARGLDRLAAAAVAARHLPVDELCERLLGQAPDGRDDVAVLAFRPDPAAP